MVMMLKLWSGYVEHERSSDYGQNFESDIFKHSTVPHDHIIGEPLPADIGPQVRCHAIRTLAGMTYTFLEV